MTGIKIKPVPGYGGALTDCNQVSVLTLADRVRRDIILPVLGYRPDSALARSDLRFLRSSGGSLLINRSAKLSLLQTGDIEHVGGITPAIFTPDDPTRWLGIEFYDRTGVDCYLRVRTASFEVLIKQMTFGDDVFWMPWLHGSIRLSAHGTPPKSAFVHVYCIG